MLVAFRVVWSMRQLRSLNSQQGLVMSACLSVYFISETTIRYLVLGFTLQVFGRISFWPLVFRCNNYINN